MSILTKKVADIWRALHSLQAKHKIFSKKIRGHDNLVIISCKQSMGVHGQEYMHANSLFTNFFLRLTLRAGPATLLFTTVSMPAAHTVPSLEACPAESCLGQNV